MKRDGQTWHQGLQCSQDTSCSHMRKKSDAVQLLRWSVRSKGSTMGRGPTSGAVGCFCMSCFSTPTPLSDLMTPLGRKASKRSQPSPTWHLSFKLPQDVHHLLSNVCKWQEPCEVHHCNQAAKGSSLCGSTCCGYQPQGKPRAIHEVWQRWCSHKGALKESQGLTS